MQRMPREGGSAILASTTKLASIRAAKMFYDNIYYTEPTYNVGHLTDASPYLIIN